MTIEDLATRDNVVNVPVALPTGYVVNRPSQTAIGDRVDANKDGQNKEVRMSFKIGTYLYYYLPNVTQKTVKQIIKIFSTYLLLS